MLLDEGLNRGEQGMPADLRRAPVADVHFVCQPRREHLQRGGRQTRRLGRTVVIDIAGQCVGMLALIAGTVSYLLVHLLVELHGQPGWVAALTPLSVGRDDRRGIDAAAG